MTEAPKERAVMAPYTIEPMQRSDWAQVRTIYLDGIATGQATFETEAPSWERWDATHLCIGRLVARTGQMILGWAALSPVSSRQVYGGVAEVSLYVGVSYRGKGAGTALLAALIAASEQHDIWTLQAVIFPENEASLALFKKCGFREVGRRERLGQLRGMWRDVSLLERRSLAVGTE
jgi:L-amino acid N-acyltransferase YncA